MTGTFQLLRGCCISCSGVDLLERSDIHRRIERLGGTISAGLTNAVTHLIVKNPQVSEKYHVAAKVDIAIVSLDFVTECEKEARSHRSSATQRRLRVAGGSDTEDDLEPAVSTGELVRQIAWRTRMLPFSNCHICSTGFSVDVRDQIKHYTTERREAADISELLLHGSGETHAQKNATSTATFLSGGGAYHGEMKIGCTHLIVHTPTGQKYKYAKQFKMHIVSLDWFLDSIITGIRQKESDYSVDSPQATASRSISNTPAHMDVVPESSFYEQQSRRISRNSSGASVESAMPQTRSSQMNNTASFFEEPFLGPRQVFSRNNTASGSLRSEPSDLLPGLGSSMLIDIEEEAATAMPAVNRSSVLAKPSAFKSRISVASELGFMPSSPLGPQSAEMDTLFDSCRIFLSEASLSSARRKEWHAKISTAGGRCIDERDLCDQSTNSVPAPHCTHYVVDDSDELCEEDMLVLQKFSYAQVQAQAQRQKQRQGQRTHALQTPMQTLDPPLIVQCGWLRACWRAKKRVDVQPFEIPWVSGVPLEPFMDMSETSAGENAAPVDKRHNETIHNVQDAPANADVDLGAQSDLRLLPPKPHHTTANARGAGSSNSASASKRYSAASLLAGRPLGMSVLGNRMSDLTNGQHCGGQKRPGAVSDDEEQQGQSLKRRKPRESLSNELKRQTTSPGVLQSTSTARSDQTMLNMGVLPRDAQACSALTGLERKTTVSSGDRQPVSLCNDGTISKGSDTGECSKLEATSDKMPFEKCMFASLGFSSAAIATLEEVVVQFGGRYIDLAKLLPRLPGNQPGTTADLDSPSLLQHALRSAAAQVDGDSISGAYLVIPLEGLDTLPLCEAVVSAHPLMHIVTECWVEQCLHDGKKYPDFEAIESQKLRFSGLSEMQHTLFRPLRSRKLKDAEAMSLSISGYEGIERDHIGKLALALEIPFSERFSRKTTHLICRRPFQGPKYERATKWKLPVVGSEWIYNIANAHNAAVALSAPYTSNKELCEQRQGLSPKMAPDYISFLARTPVSKNFHGQRSGQPTGVRGTGSPICRVANSGLALGTPGRTPIDISLEKNLAQALGNNKNQQPRHLASGNYGDDDATQMSPTPGARTIGSMMNLINPTHASEGLASTALDAATDGETKNVLDGVVIALTARLYHRLNELAPLSMQLGCRFLARFDASRVTHLVHQSPREKETLKDYRTAIEKGISVVSPFWLYACHAAMERLPEADFPFTYHPERRLALVSTSPPKSMQSPSSVQSGTAVDDRSKTLLVKRPLWMSISKPVTTMTTTTTIDMTKQKPIADRFGKLTSPRKTHLGQPALRQLMDNSDPNPTSLAPEASPSAISSLIAQKALHTRRRYRQTGKSMADGDLGACTSTSSSDEITESDTASKSTSALHGQAKHGYQATPSDAAVGEIELIRGKTVGDGPAHSTILKPPLVVDTGSGIGGISGSAHVGSLQISNKWWHHADAQTGTGYVSGSQMRLYSQEFQLSGDKSLDSMPNTGAIGETQGMLGPVSELLLPITPGLPPMRSSGSSRARELGEDRAARASADKDKDGGRLSRHQPAEATGIQSGSGQMLVAQKTTIVYEEDAKALSERDQLLARLSGS
ncbi:protein kinase activating protein dpb11 [Coemansia sp. Benny D115]|nr:protein kinase activating protein dpb11 [Coemansia sp. Benny D115]